MNNRLLHIIVLIILILLISVIFLLDNYKSTNDKSTNYRQLTESELWNSYELLKKRDKVNNENENGKNDREDKNDKSDKDDLKAKEILQIILERNPQNSIALNNMAIIYIKEKVWDSAYSYLQKANEHSKNYRIKQIVTLNILKNEKGELKAFKTLIPGLELDAEYPIHNNYRTLVYPEQNFY